MTHTFDAIIIGAGQAGPSLAGRLTAADHWYRSEADNDEDLRVRALVRLSEPRKITRPAGSPLQLTAPRRSPPFS
jgi:flavin-dependent dehydrogenase